MDKNYGEILTAQEKERASSPGLEQRQKRMTDEVKWKRMEQDFRNYFSDFLAETLDALDAKTPLKRTRISPEIEKLRYAEGNYTETKIVPTDPRHAFYDVFGEIQREAIRDFGLKFAFDIQHDGGGMEDWQEVVMVAAGPDDVIWSDSGSAIPIAGRETTVTAMLLAGIDRRTPEDKAQDDIDFAEPISPDAATAAAADLFLKGILPPEGAPLTRAQELFAEAETLRNRLRNVERELMSVLYTEYTAQKGDKEGAP